MGSDFSSVLIANRGEIACRVIRSAKALGYRTVAVYSDADVGAPHVELADQAVRIGEGPVATSYLDMDKILAAAQKTGADAVHPGYGFLSENTDFAAACAKAGITFIGPSADAINVMGNKAEAKRRMIAAKVPCIPGYEDPDQSDKALTAAAKKIGAPIMVKAAAGGGGRGMRLVEDLKDIQAALDSARSEAKNAFGSDELILEKAVVGARHVEVQVFGDSHGNVIHFGERDCSVQRRHQKVLEEAPCPVMTEDLRAAMGQAAVDAAKAIDYVGAGTVEFLLGADNEFYFLEMNTRLQVEHPVTEMVTGVDLVALQLKVARGDELGIAQDDVSLTGHAIEARLYAEDPSKDFLPSAGLVSVWRPADGDGIRIDHGLNEGQEISPFYDPMVAKVIAWGPDRDAARRRLTRALQDTDFHGPQSNRDFLCDVLNHDTFAMGQATTTFLDNDYDVGDLPSADIGDAALAAMLLYRAGQDRSAKLSVGFNDELKDWHSAGELYSRFSLPVDGEEVLFQVVTHDHNSYRILSGDEAHEYRVLSDDGRSLRVAVDDVQSGLTYAVIGDDTVYLNHNGKAVSLTNGLTLAAAAGAAAGGGNILAPMHGRLHKLMVAVGDQVEAGAPLAILEAMKMEHEIETPVAGKVVAVNVAVDDQVPADTLIIEIEEPEKD